MLFSTFQAPLHVSLAMEMTERQLSTFPLLGLLGDTLTVPWLEFVFNRNRLELSPASDLPQSG